MNDGAQEERREPGPAASALFDRLARVDAERHFFRRLDARHSAVHARCGTGTLVVTFERVEGVIGDGEGAAMPLGLQLGDVYGWSYLSVLAMGEGWFRAGAVAAFFDELTDADFFDAFDRVLFFGAGTSAHAACAYSVAAPGATVMAFSPQATLNPEYAAFDHRFTAARRLDFTSRYGYAPDMLDAATAAHVFYDPAIGEDAAHAAQFNRRHIHRHRLWHFGENPARVLEATDTLTPVFGLYEEDRLDPVALARVLRARRQNRAYLLSLIDRLVARDRRYLAAVACNNVAERLGAPRFRNRRDALAAELNAQGIRLPFQDAGNGAAESARA